MSSATSNLKLIVDAGEGSDAEETAALSERLRRELLQADVEDVHFVREGTAPAGAKGDPLTMGALAIALAPAALTSFCNLLQTWLSRHEKSTVTIETGTEKILLTGPPSKEQREIIKAALERNAAQTAPGK